MQASIAILHPISPMKMLRCPSNKVVSFPIIYNVNNEIFPPPLSIGKQTRHFPRLFRGMRDTSYPAEAPHLPLSGIAGLFKPGVLQASLIPLFCRELFINGIRYCNPFPRLQVFVILTALMGPMSLIS